LGDKIKDDEMGRISGAYREKRNACGKLVGKPEETRPSWKTSAKSAGYLKETR
jgi:hypothetical protein